MSERGLSISTREICEPLGVTQALLYRYFPSRAALIDAALEKVFAHLWSTDWAAQLNATRGTLEERLTLFYTPYVNTSTATFMRLFMWCALAGNAVPQRFFVPLTNKILQAVVGVMREAAELPPLTDRPMTYGERELAMTLHTAVVFIMIRKHIYRMALPDDVGALVAMQVRAFAPGALGEMLRLQDIPTNDTQAVPVLDVASNREQPQSTSQRQRATPTAPARTKT